jgi:hypothetical protein
MNLLGELLQSRGLSGSHSFEHALNLAHRTRGTFGDRHSIRTGPAMTEVMPAAKAQLCASADVVRAILTEEAASRDTANLRVRRTLAALKPSGKQRPRLK